MKYHRFSKELKLELDQLAKPNNYRAIFGLLYDYLVIGLSIYVTLQWWYFYPIAIVLIGARQRAFVTLLHDAGHRVLFKSQKANNFVAKYLTGYTIFLLFDRYVVSHAIKHHGNLGDADKDPDFQYYNFYGLFNFSLSKREFRKKHLIKPILFGHTPLYTLVLILHRWGQIKEGTREARIMSVYWGLILFVCSYYGWLLYLFLFWIIPFLLIFPWLGWFVGIAEHYPLIKNEKEIEMTWNRFSHPIEAFFTSIHNENLHLTHHLRSDIPYWNLTNAHEIMMKDEEYNKLNSQMGGIFWSSNKQLTFWQKAFYYFDMNAQKVIETN